MFSLQIWKQELQKLPSELNIKAQFNARWRILKIKVQTDFPKVAIPESDDFPKSIDFPKVTLARN